MKHSKNILILGLGGVGYYLAKRLAHEGYAITVIESASKLIREADGSLHPVQQAMVDHHGSQCGFCTPGFVVAAAHLLEQDPHPSRDDIKEALSGNICRCTGYGAILRGLQALAEEAS